MNKEILYVVDAVSNEKNVEPDVIFGAVELALATATRKRYSLDWDVRVEIDRETGDYSSYRRWIVLDDEDPEFNDLKRQILFSYAQRKEVDIEVGDYIEEAIDSVEFGRIAAQSAKQVIVQKVREAERQRVVDQYRERIGELIIGTVKRRERRGIILDLGENAEALIPREEMLSREMARVGGRMRGYLKEVRDEGRSPRVIVSRVDPNFLIELMKLEVPEIGQEMIDIKAVARDPGSRSKVAVMSNIPNLDPVGACVGMRGSRIQTVTDELNKERVDIILWDEDIATFVIKAMSPAEVLSILVDEERQSMDISVADDRLSQAIGVGGQNVRLASELTGWHLNVMTETQMLERDVEDQQKVLNLFMTHLDVEEDIASILVEEGFTSIDEVAYVSDEEFLSIEVFDEGIVAELRSRAENALLTMAISSEGDLPHEDLKTMDGMDEELAFRLAKEGVKSMEDLAELSVDELLEKGELGEENEEYAGQLIMIARAPWFADDNDE